MVHSAATHPRTLFTLHKSFVALLALDQQNKDVWRANATMTPS